MLIDILVLALLVFLIGFLSSAELAVLSVGHSKIKLRAENGEKKAVLIKRVQDNPQEFLSTIQISVLLLSLFTGVYAAQVLAKPVANYLIQAGVSREAVSLGNVAVFLITMLMSYFITVFGALVPKRLGNYESEKIANMVIEPVNLWVSAFSPFVKVLTVSADAITKIVGIDGNKADGNVTEEEIRMMVDAGSETGTIGEDEMEMINNIFEFDDKTAEDICTHRTDISAIDADGPLSEIIPFIMKMKNSRMPVYRENLDNIIGVLHIKDFMKFILENHIDIYSGENIDFSQLARPAYFVPTSKPTDKLFEQMRTKKIQMCIVVDEYGGTVGLVTIEDLIEEIMGNIFDEYDDEENPEIQELDPNTFEIAGTTDLEDVAKALDIELPVDEYDTISGFIISQLGRIPSEGETPEIEFNGVLFKVALAQEKRIGLVTACRTA